MAEKKEKPKIVSVFTPPEKPRPKIVTEEDFSFILEKKEPEKKKAVLPERLQEEAAKEVLPVEITPGMPLEAAKGPLEKIREALGAKRRKKPVAPVEGGIQ